MKTKRFTVSRYSVPFRSALFSRTFEVVASSKGEAVRIAMGFETYAPRRCFGIPRRLAVLTSH